MPAGPIEIHQSPLSMLKLLAAGVVMTLGSACLAFGWIPAKSEGLAEFAGWVGLLFFGFATALIAYRFMSTRGPVVILTDSGIRDIRIAPEEIPWSAVWAIGAVQISRQRFLVLAVDPACEAGLTLSMTVKWTRNANRRLGVDGLCVTAQGLAIDFAQLQALCHERLRAAGMLVI
jgi:hypothetical protein